MNNFYKVVTPSELLKLHPDIENTVEELKAIADVPNGICPVCKQEDIWKYGQCGMCFTCTTGEADAYEDYELKPEGANDAEKRKE